MRKSIRKNNKNTKRKSLKKYSGGRIRTANTEDIGAAIATLLGIPALCILLIYLQYINNQTGGGLTGGGLTGGANPPPTTTQIFIIKSNRVTIDPDIAKMIKLPSSLLNGESINTRISAEELGKIMEELLSKYTGILEE